MKRFTVETVTITATRFTGMEFRACFDSEHTDEEIAALLEQDPVYHRIIQEMDDFGARTTHTETTAYTRTIAPQEEPA